MLSLFSKRIILASPILLCIGCSADLVLLYIFGRQIPGYNQLSCTISSLGESASPISGSVTIWSVILGTIIILFGLTFREVFRGYGKLGLRASLLIIFYGFGENIASGVIKDDYVNGRLTAMAVLHNLLGGIGVIALLLLPLLMMKILTKEQFHGFYLFSRIVSVVGFISILLFSFRIINFDISSLNYYKGLWQRIFLVDYYIYFIAIALIMIGKISKIQDH